MNVAKWVNESMQLVIGTIVIILALALICYKCDENDDCFSDRTLQGHNETCAEDQNSCKTNIITGT